MRAISQRLHSRRGSSLFLAIVFFMFCFFVGGSVLAAATANAGRIKAMKVDRRDYYAQRSAAMVIQDQFADPVQLTIKSVTTTITTVDPAGNIISSTDGGTVTTAELSASEADMTPLQLLLVKVAEEAISGSTDVEGIEVSLTSGGVTMSALLTCDYTSATEFGDCVFSIQSLTGGESQFRVTLDANGYTTTSTGSKAPQALPSGRYQLTKLDTVSTTITWNKAVIRKGGA